MARTATVTRNTRETQITLTIDLDGTGKTDLHTGIGFFDHMLDGFARHGLFDLSGLTASDPSVQFMGTLNEEISDAQQTNNIDGSATTDVYDTATPAPDDSTDGDSTDGDSTPSE